MINKKKEYDDAITSKAYMNELKLEYNKEGFDYIEKARMIEFLMKEKKMSVRDLSKKLNMCHQEVYRIKGILKCSDKILDWILKGKVKASIVSKIIYSLKEKDIENLEKTTKHVIDNDMTWRETEEMVAELNSDEVFGNHLNIFLLKTNEKLLKAFLKKPSLFKLIDDGKKKEIIKEIKDLQSNLERIEKLCEEKITQ